MSNYYLILVWVAVAWMIGLCTKVQRTEYVCGEKVQRYYPLWAFLIYLPLVIWSGFRGYVGDTGAYMKMFQEIPSGLRNIPSYMDTIEKDKGFYLRECRAEQDSWRRFGCLRKYVLHLCKTSGIIK